MRRILIIIAMLGMMAVAQAQSKFEAVSGRPGVEHTHISSEMLKLMQPGTSITNSAMNISAEDLTSVDIIYTRDLKVREELWKIQREIRKQEKLTELARRVSGNAGRVDLFGKVGKNGKLTHMMLIEQDGMGGTRIIYLEGSFDPDNITVGW